MKPEDRDLEDQIVAIIDEYMHILGVSGEGPFVEVKNNLGSKWLGRTNFRGGEIWIEVQRRATADPETLEKVLAHEMVHFVEMSTLEGADLALARLGRSVEHGRRFWELAQAVNVVKGENYVTEESDSSYELAPNDRVFTLLVHYPMRDRIGWRWAARRTPAIDRIIARLVLEDGAVVVESTDERFLSGAKLGKGKIGSSLAKPGSELEADLQEIYRAAREGAAAS
jgi:hypothetical protein